MSKSIYLIGSLRNARVPAIATLLRDDYSFDVFDDWYGAGHEADDMWQKYEDARGRNYREALAGHAAQHIFNFDRTHIQRCDAVMLVLPAGKSGHLEFGFARGLGKPGVILLDDGEPERFDVMYNFANLVTSEVEEAAEFVANHPKPKRAEGLLTDLTVEALRSIAKHILETVKE
jgi:nucleoside 2-deoxyribosyltransferase